MSLPNLTCASHSATSERRLTDNISFLFFMSEIVLDTLCFLLCASSPSCTLCAFIYSLSLALSTIAGWWWWFILAQNVSTNMPFHPIVSLLLVIYCSQPLSVRDFLRLHNFLQKQLLLPLFHMSGNFHDKIIWKKYFHCDSI